MPLTRKRRRSGSGAPPEHHRPDDDSPTIADPPDWGPCGGHPLRATSGFVGCSPSWPPEDGEPRSDSTRVAEESAEFGSLEAAPAVAKLERRLGEGGEPR